jgi:alpha-L-fucosidase
VKHVLITTCLILLVLIQVKSQGNDLDRGQVAYVPSEENLKNREWFRDARFGMFIHWGVSSVIGEEIGWALLGKDVEEYRQYMHAFNPVKFDAAAVVKLARDAGMKYITFTTRHHDSFSMFDTKYSDWGIMHTPYGKDVLKMLAEECRKQDMRLFCYYSLTDFYRGDYCRGNQEKGKGIKGPCDWDSYLQFMKDQLTELLTYYGPVYGIWLDGHWDQVRYTEDGHMGSQMRAWHYDELYTLIHRLQPGCMIVNNHHLPVFPGEDYQTFERDLPGQNTGAGFSADAEISMDLPLETSDIIGHHWGYVNGDTVDRSVKELIHLLVRSAGLDANLLLNVGPTPEGEIRPAHRDRLLAIGQWLETYGESIYGTRQSFMDPAPWGVAVEKEGQIYLHILESGFVEEELLLPDFPFHLKHARDFITGKEIPFQVEAKDRALHLKLAGLPPDTDIVDRVLVLELTENP